MVLITCTSGLIGQGGDPHFDDAIRLSTPRPTDQLEFAAVCRTSALFGRSKTSEVDFTDAGNCILPSAGGVPHRTSLFPARNRCMAVA